ALLVKVMARTCCGWTPISVGSHAMRRVMTRVFPDPGPARMSIGPVPCVTASRCGGLSPSSRLVEGSADTNELCCTSSPILFGEDSSRVARNAIRGGRLPDQDQPVRDVERVARGRGAEHRIGIAVV